jgi:hypothetical protein
MLELANIIIKFVQANNTFMCDFLGGIQVLKYASILLNDILVTVVACFSLN